MKTARELSKTSSVQQMHPSTTNFALNTVLIRGSTARMATLVLVNINSKRLLIFISKDGVLLR